MIINKSATRNRRFTTDGIRVLEHDGDADDFRKLMEVDDNDVLNEEQRKHLLFQYVKDCLDEMLILDDGQGEQESTGLTQLCQMKWKLHNGPLAGCVFEATRYHDSLTLEIHAPDDKAEWLSENIGWVTSRMASLVKIISIKKKDDYGY